MQRPYRVAVATLIALGLFIVWPGAVSAQVDARMLRYADVSDTHIVFVYAGDIWVVAKSGGVAQRLSTPTGEEQFPRFSPDGSRIAFQANYDGNVDIYVVPTLGGQVERLTHHPMPDRMLDWYPDGDSILIASFMQTEKMRYRKFFRIGATGGLPERLPVPYGEFGAISPDGGTIAYMPKSRDFRTWKRYRGGTAPEIWLFDLNSYAATNITENTANDGHPMWHGDTLYFLSDRGPRERANIWAYDRADGTSRQVTQFTDFDVRFPAIGPDDLVFEAGGRLYLLDLANEQMNEVQIEVVTDRSTLKPHSERVAGQIASAGISPSGARAVVEARGEMFSVPAEKGIVRNLSRSSGFAERWPQWSPDGRWIAYFSDESGEYELTIRPADGSGEPERLTTLGEGFRYTPYWSPDSSKLAFIDQAMQIWIHDRDAGTTTQIDKGLYLYHGGLANFEPDWSADSNWLAYSHGLPNPTQRGVSLRSHEQWRAASGDERLLQRVLAALRPGWRVPVRAHQPQPGAELQRHRQHVHLRQHDERGRDRPAQRRAFAVGSGKRRGRGRGRFEDDDSTKPRIRRWTMLTPRRADALTPTLTLTPMETRPCRSTWRTSSAAW